VIRNASSVSLKNLLLGIFVGATMLLISPELVRVRVDRENSTGCTTRERKSY
jgi:hypothetical protein